MTEVWFRNPLTYIRECAELLVPNIVWDRGLLVKNRVDPVKHLELHLPFAVQYRLLLVGDQGAAELRRGFPMKSPYAVYPCWEYGAQGIGELEELLRVQKLPTGPVPDERGVKGQEHRVVIIRPPKSNTLAGKAFIATLRELQFEYPDAIVHYHGTYSYTVAFGMGWGAADIEPVSHSAKGRVTIGSGRSFPWEEAVNYPSWVALSGCSVPDLAVARNRTMFNMRSAIWASTNFNEQNKFRVRPNDEVIDTTSIVPVPVSSPRRIYNTNLKVQQGDKFLCDLCSLAPTCKYQRDKGVCAIPDADTSGLARYFKTRDSDQIITGLGRLMEKEIERAERAMDAEKVSPDIDPEVTRMLKSIFDQGVKLAKLVNPNLAGGTKVGVFINGAGGAVQVGSAGETANALVSTVVAELEAQGIERKDIDAEMVAQYIAGRNRVAIEATAT